VDRSRKVDRLARWAMQRNRRDAVHRGIVPSSFSYDT